MNTQILWMHDLSAGAEACEGPLRALARWMDGEILLVHATGAPLVEKDAERDPVLATRREHATAQLEPVLARFQTQGVAARLVVAPGQALELAESLIAGASSAIVVVGATGVSGLDRVLLGSTAGRLVRHLSCSVLVVRGALPHATRLMCAVDPAEPSEAAILTATALALRASARLDYIAVVPAVLDLAETEPAERAVAAQVASATGEALRTGWAVRTVVAETPVSGILHVADSYDLVVVGTHSRTGLRRLLLGSTSEEVVSRSPVCVLVAR